MKKVLIISLLMLAASSCLKKIEGADSVNTNIFDPEFGGAQWFMIDTIFEFTNQFNNPQISIDFFILPEYTPELKPSSIDIAGYVNNGDLKMDRSRCVLRWNI
jgi:hypothetical protein